MTPQSAFTKEGATVVLIDKRPSPVPPSSRFRPSRGTLTLCRRPGIARRSQISRRPSVADLLLCVVSSVLGDGCVVACSAGASRVKMTRTDAVLEDSGTLRRPGEAS